MSLNIQYPRLYALESIKGISFADKISHKNISHSFSRHPTGGVAGSHIQVLASILLDVVLSQIQDRWVWSLMGRMCLDDQRLPMVFEPTRWVKSIPIKIHVFA